MTRGKLIFTWSVSVKRFNSLRCTHSPSAHKTHEHFHPYLTFINLNRIHRRMHWTLSLPFWWSLGECIFFFFSLRLLTKSRQIVRICPCPRSVCVCVCSRWKRLTRTHQLAPRRHTPAHACRAIILSIIGDYWNCFGFFFFFIYWIHRCRTRMHACISAVAAHERYEYELCPGGVGIVIFWVIVSPSSTVY